MKHSFLQTASALAAGMLLVISCTSPAASGPAETVLSKSVFTKAVNSYDFIGDFSEGLACVCNDGKYGYIDDKGKVAIEPSFAEAGPFSEGMAFVKTRAGYGFINSKGEFICRTPAGIVPAGKFCEGLMAVRDEKSGLAGYIDNTGALKIPCTSYAADGFLEGVALVINSEGKSKKSFSYIDANGTVVSNPTAEELATYTAVDPAFGEVLTTVLNEKPALDLEQIIEKLHVNGKIGQYKRAERKGDRKAARDYEDELDDIIDRCENIYGEYWADRLRKYIDACID